MEEKTKLAAMDLLHKSNSIFEEHKYADTKNIEFDKKTKEHIRKMALNCLKDIYIILTSVEDSDFDFNRCINPKSLSDT